MDAASVLTHSNATPFSFSSPKMGMISLRRFSKHPTCKFHLRSQYRINFKPLANHLSFSPFPSFSYSSRERIAERSFLSSPLLPSKPSNWGNQWFQPLRSAYSDNAIAESENPLLKSIKSLSFESLKARVSKLTPIKVCKWSLVFAIAVAASKWTFSVLVNPFFWMYFSWTWLFWPWMVAISLAIYGIYCLGKHLRGESNAFEQLAVVTSAFTWLTLVPPAHFNGFLEGWPFVFLFVYHYFFFLNVSVRKRLYGDYYLREHDPKWDISLPSWHKLLFCAGVMVAHWFAAFEGPELHLIPGGWSNMGVWILIMLTLFMQYHSTLYLAKYPEKVVVPTAVVQFGPYRFVRHPIYASTMLLFVTYFSALRAPLSALFVIVVCLLYYGEKAKLEEALMEEAFGESYTDYMSKVRYKLIPLVY